MWEIYDRSNNILAILKPTQEKIIFMELIIKHKRGNKVSSRKNDRYQSKVKMTGYR